MKQKQDTLHTIHSYKHSILQSCVSKKCIVQSIVCTLKLYEIIIFVYNYNIIIYTHAHAHDAYTPVITMRAMYRTKRRICTAYILRYRGYFEAEPRGM